MLFRSHGFDPISELGARHLMITAEFNNTENNVLPVDIDFHQIGLLVNPTTYSDYPIPANSEIYRTTTDLIVAPGFGVFVPLEISDLIWLINFLASVFLCLL